MLENIVLSKNNNVWLECKTTLNVPASNIIGATKILVEENESMDISIRKWKIGDVEQLKIIKY